jgi:phospholipase/carboxylesterase
MRAHSASEVLRLGPALEQARGQVILLHGRGSSASDIAGLARALPTVGTHFVAPNATGGAWYPQRFLAPLAQNEPWLSNALEVVDQLMLEASAAGIEGERMGLVGFSQGACLALEWAIRRSRRLGFVAALSGALIGPIDTPRPYADLAGTPILLGCAAEDAHIPLDYVEHSATVLARCGAEVSKQIYPGGAHTVFAQEIAWLRERLADWV